MPRRLPAPPPYAELGAHLRRLRTTAGWTQRELASHAGVSRSAVQEAEAGRRAPTRAVLKRVLKVCGASEAEHAAADLLRARGRSAQRGRRYGLHAPAPASIRTEADLRAALAAAYETGGHPPMRDFSRLVPPGGDPVSPAGASRIHRGKALPATAGQLETWLALCRVPRKELPHYRAAYAEITGHRAPRQAPARQRHAAAARPALVIVAEGEQESVELTGLAAAVARQLPAATLEQILLTGITRLAGAQARRNGGGTYLPDLWITTPAGRDAAPKFILVEAKRQHGPGTPPPPEPLDPSPAGPARPGPGPGRNPDGRHRRAPGRQPHAAAAPRAPAA